MKHQIIMTYDLHRYYEDIESGKHSIEELKTLIVEDIQMVTKPLNSAIICFNFDDGFGYPTTFVKEIAQTVAKSCPIYLMYSAFMIRSVHDETIPDMFKKYMLEYYHSINVEYFYSINEVRFHEN